MHLPSISKVDCVGSMSIDKSSRTVLKLCTLSLFIIKGLKLKNARHIETKVKLDSFPLINVVSSLCTRYLFLKLTDKPNV